MNSRKLGHRSGKSYPSIRCMMGMSCWRTRGCEDARMGRRRSRSRAFSSSAMRGSAGNCSDIDQARLTRFLR